MHRDRGGIHCFTAAVRFPWRIHPLPLRGLSSRWTVSVAGCLPLPTIAQSAGGAGVMLLMGMDVTGASCKQLFSANTIVYKLLQLGHNLPQGWSVLCWQLDSRYQTSDIESIFSSVLSQLLLLCTDESTPLSILQYASRSDARQLINIQNRGC